MVKWHVYLDIICRVRIRLLTVLTSVWRIRDDSGRRCWIDGKGDDRSLLVSSVQAKDGVLTACRRFAEKRLKKEVVAATIVIPDGRRPTWDPATGAAHWTELPAAAGMTGRYFTAVST